ncbi:solute carrier family 2, facilitated glucose transporter member 5-like [Amphiura filiformis]|uniref:solute carrier family 2, facilitated glucose transporter member 5-like n=1 Tax=Amphiura filiformis TaxID=82378 RepID=UPI003B224735
MEKQNDLPGLIEEDPRTPVINREELHGKVTLWLVISTVVVSIGAVVPLGYNLGVTTVAAPFILEFLNVTNQELWNGNAPDLAITWIYSCTVTIYAVGGALGATIGGRFCDALGRKYSLVVSAILLPLAGLLMGICQIAGIYGLLFLGRFVAGLYAGISLGIIPVYLAEISPINLRGAVGVFAVFMTVVGQLLSHVIGFWGFYDQKSWPILLSLVGFMGMILIVVFPFCPESPRWLFLKQKRYRDAEIALQRLRGKTADISTEIEEMKLEALRDESNSTDGRVGAMDIIRLKNPEWKNPILICLILTVGYHFSGISALFFYTTEIFKSAGLNQEEIALATVGYSSINLIATVIGVLLVDKVGRRPLLLYPFMAGLVLLVGMTVTINTQEELGGYTFLIYFACLLAVTIVMYRYLPETKNKTFAEITANFVKSPKHKRKRLEEDLEAETYVNGGAVKETNITEETKT